MVYVQFFQKSAISDDIIEACGDRSVVILDGRERLNSHLSIAHAECIKRGYLAYQLMSGESFTRSVAVTSVQKV